MAEDRKLFSESWHRVGPQKIRLRPSVRVRKQFFRGELWFVARDAYSDQFYRFRPEAWDFISRLDGTRTVEDIWQQAIERNGEAAPGQQEVIQMLASLYNGNLIVSDFPADVATLFERQKKRLSREWKARIFGIFFLRIPLWDPDAFLGRTLRYLQPLLSWPGVILWTILVGIGLSKVIGEWDALFDQSAGVLDPGNLPLLLLAFVLAKVLHEFGHGYALKRLGGEVHAMGITFLVFTPIPYVDATQAWALRERWKRVWVGSAGMIVEFALAAAAAIIWSSTGPGLLNAWCYNLMIAASVSTLLFNINPLLRFDGYYILADLTDSPNLQPRSGRMWAYLTERYAFGGRFAQNPANGVGDGIWLASFGLASYVYRIFITFTIVMFVADRYLGLGFLAAVLTIVGLVFVPIYKVFAYLLHEPRIERVRGRAWAVSAGFVALLVVLLGLIPAPRHLRAPGILQAKEAAYLMAGAPGEVVFPDTVPATVEGGELVARLANPQLELEIQRLEAEEVRLEALYRAQLAREGLGREALEERRRATSLRLAELRDQLQNLELRIPRSGRWSGDQPRELQNRWVNRGQAIGEIVPEGDWRFLAVLSQQDSAELFEQEVRRLGIRFPGTAGMEVEPTRMEVVPGQQEYLPSAALGWPSKGPVRTKANDETGRRTAEPFFLVVMDVEGTQAPLWHGRTGVARLTVDPEPLGFQWYRWLRQAVQERFLL